MRRRRLLVLAAVLILILAFGYLNRSAIRSGLDAISGADYAGPGHGSVTLVIEKGDDGSVIAKRLVDLGVVKTYRTVYKLLVSRNQTFYPGSYALNLQMSSPAALDAIADPKNRISNRVTIKEGWRITVTLVALAKTTDIPESSFKSAAENLSAIGVPTGEVSAEGWLFPATYEFDPGTDATTVLSTMVKRTKAELEKFGVAQKDWHRVLTLAALVQKEGRLTADFYKISRVFQNRISAGMHLQSDATVSYGVNGSTVSTSASDRANPNGYNTYLNPGLPIGPIGAPGSIAIDAALHPAAGKWLYFCAINLATGETVFSNTYAEHQAAVRQWQAWMKANPGYD